MWNARVLSLTSRAQVEAEMAAVGVDPLGVRIMLPKALFRVVKVEGLPTNAANIVKQEMLAKGGEAALSWAGSLSASAKTDVLLMGTARHFARLVARLRMHPFGLRDLADELREALDQYESPLPPSVWRGTTFTWGSRTYVMGIVNVTPDSFSGDGLGADVPAVVAQAVRMVEEGADLIDVGGESTRPGHKSVSVKEELRRVLPALHAVRQAVEVPLSIDTYKSEVAAAALAAGADLVNDIWGLRRDPHMAHVVAEAKVPVILMHNQEGTQYTDLMADIMRSLRESIALARVAGIPESNILLDPGIGFGKRREQNLEVLARLDELRVLGRPILVGTSRKSTLGHILGTPPDDRLEGTAATAALAIAKGADILRVHDVKQIVRVARVADAVERGRWQEYS
ncbi:MAG: dihydropteroate synthase [Chloroflexi bacterium]|nr:dihydropteroate synthase [Chloroflexota bacterium]MCL5108211.1 dihydropteroate synthase [Chloroflexota bacterium]